MSGNIQNADLGLKLVSSGAAPTQPISVGYYPEEGSRVVGAAYVWTTVTGYVEDLSQLVARGMETTIQTAYVDNSGSAQPVTILIYGTDQIIVAPANSQGCYPCFFTGIPGFQISVPAVASGGITKIHFLNVGLTMGPWQANTIPGSGGTVAISTIQKPAPALIGASHIIVAGGTAQTAFAAGVITNQGVIRNPNTATESLFVDMVQAAGVVDGNNGTTVELQPGDSFNVPPVTGAVSVNAATTGHAFFAVSV